MSIPRFYTLDEIAEIASAPRSSVNFWVYSDRLRSVKVGRRRLVTEPDLIKFLGLPGDDESKAQIAGSRRGRK
jgi:excisionase family DNA binding protein